MACEVQDPRHWSCSGVRSSEGKESKEIVAREKKVKENRSKEKIHKRKQV